MKYAVLILAVVAIQGSIGSENCTRTNRQSNICAKQCDPAQNDCSGSEDCVCDGDCGYSCVKRDLRCPILGSITNGRVKLKNTTFRSVARYRCSQTYTAVGTKKRRCRGNGTWDGQEPTCKLMCQDPGNILNGTRKQDGFEVGQKVTYTCSTGFKMEGSSTLTCTRTRAWNRDKPKCTCKRTNREAFRYCKSQCNPGSAVSCSRKRECVCDGDCGYSCVPKAADCGRPSTLENGKREYSSIKLGSTVKYRCNKPYTLIGSKIRTCRGIRRWDGTEPSCKIICKDPGDVEFGTKQFYRRNYDEDYVEVGDKVEYSCYPNYKIEGSNYLTCTATGEWNREKPKCTVPTCDPPKLPANADFRIPAQKRKTSFRFAEKVLLKCQTGYFQTGIGLRTCGSNGWTGPSFTCSPKSCGNPGTPANGKLKSYVFTFKRKVYFECYSGYKLVGDKYRQCQANQRWSGNVPTCKPIDCGSLPTPDKAEKVLQTNTRFGGVVKFQCKERGYELIGSEIRTCLNSESWSGFQPSCKIVNCGDPGTPTNGKRVDVKNGYNYGGSVEFTCKLNYTLAGSSKIFCEATKDWSSPIPRCWAPCPDPGVPSNGSRNGDDFRHGKSVSFKCRDDYEREGDATIDCRDGKWTDGIPRCKVISCGDPGSPAQGRQAKIINNFAFGGIVKFKCDENYTLQGRSSLYCQRNKRWDGDVPKCLAFCPNPGHPVNGKTIGSVFEHDSVVKFECLGDRVLEGDSMMKCIDGQWNGKLPTCRDCNEGFPIGIEDYRCFNNKQSSFKIKLPKKYKITAASIHDQLGKDREKLQSVQLYARISKRWTKFEHSKRPFGEGGEKLVLIQPVITQSLQIKLWTHQKTSICLKAQMYGCEAVPRGCIMQGSAVLFKEGGKYLKGRYVATTWRHVEVVYEGEYKYKTKGEVILDEKPKASELAEGIPVVGEDSRGLLREGKIKQLSSSTCTIETNGEVWQSELDDVRVFKAKLCK